MKNKIKHEHWWEYNGKQTVGMLFFTKTFPYKRRCTDCKKIQYYDTGASNMTDGHWYEK